MERQSGTKLEHYPSQFLNVSQVAKKLGKARKTIREWCRTGKLPALTRGYGNTATYLISHQALELLSLSTLNLEKPKINRVESHKDYIQPWKQAMKQGLIGGKAFSERTIGDYLYYATQFLNSYPLVSVDNLKLVLLKIPTYQFAKREKLFKSICCLGKYLISEGLLDTSFLDEVKSIRPKRHVPPKRHTVSQDGLYAIVAACSSTFDELLVNL